MEKYTDIHLYLMIKKHYGIKLLYTFGGDFKVLKETMHQQV